MRHVERLLWVLLLATFPFDLAADEAAPASANADDAALSDALKRCAFAATEINPKTKAEVQHACQLVAKPNGMTLPEKANAHLPALVNELKSAWPDLRYHAAIAAQVEQESCLWLTHKKCWDPRAELKTDREYGFGFGQITKVWSADGKVQFDVFEDLKKLDGKLKGWKWDDRFDPAMQLRSIAVLNRNNYRKLQFPVANEIERLAFTFAAYNGGFGAVLKDRALCTNQEGCDPSRWFGNVEKYSFKARRAYPGYAKSFFEINREYPVNVLFVRMPKYAAVLPPLPEAAPDPNAAAEAAAADTAGAPSPND
jgi:hypothetical protein